jgi:hypothetical protein
MWAMVFWIEGLAKNNSKYLFAAGCLIAFAEMTKYYGACLMPLLVVYSITNKKRIGRWGQYLLIPLFVLCVYQYITQHFYGYSLLYQAADYASFSKNAFGFSNVTSGLTGLAFTGGCVASTLFLYRYCGKGGRS